MADKETANKRAREVRRGVQRGPSSRASFEAIQNQRLVNAIRHILGLDDLYVFAAYDMTEPAVETMGPVRGFAIRYAGDWDRPPHEPHPDRERGAVIREAIARQIERDKYRAKARDAERDKLTA